MTISTPTSPPPLRSNLPRKIIMLFLLDIFSGLGIAILVMNGHPLAYLFMILFDASVLGLVSGFGARIILKDRRMGWRLLASPAAMTSGLFILGVATSWKYGIGPLSFKAGRFDWAALIQVVTGILVANMSLFAWRKTASVQLPAQELQPTPPNLNLNRTLEQINQPAPVRATPTISEKASKLSGTSSTSFKSTRKSINRKPAKIVPETPKTTKSKRRSHKPDVQFSTNEKFRCPYCLEPVLPNDARGIVECKICHTQHHADCWAITGVCQVPHQNT